MLWVDEPTHSEIILGSQQGEADKCKLETYLGIAGFKDRINGRHTHYYRWQLFLIDQNTLNVGGNEPSLAQGLV